MGGGGAGCGSGTYGRGSTAGGGSTAGEQRRPGRRRPADLSSASPAWPRWNSTSSLTFGSRTARVASRPCAEKRWVVDTALRRLQSGLEGGSQMKERSWLPSARATSVTERAERMLSCLCRTSRALAAEEATTAVVVPSFKEITGPCIAARRAKAWCSLPWKWKTLPRRGMARCSARSALSPC